MSAIQKNSSVRSCSFGSPSSYNVSSESIVSRKLQKKHSPTTFYIVRMFY